MAIIFIIISLLLISIILKALSKKFKLISGKLILGTFISALLLNLLLLIQRWFMAKHAPLSNTHETLLYFSLLIFFLYFWIIKLDKKQIFLIGIILIILMLLTGSLVTYTPIQKLNSSLRTPWLIIHVGSIFISYAAFCISFMLSILYFFMHHSKRLIQDVCHRMISLGFPFLTFGIISGGAWANQIWGTYWSWDPKETWALITWIIYCLYLHTPKIFIAFMGFLFVLFTYFGVNYLLPSLHSYL